jgi:FkbM family methyltransferase
MTRSHFRVKRLIQTILITAVVAVLGFCTALIAAPSSQFAQDIAVRMALLGIRTWRFPTAAQTMYHTCSVADAWANATHETANGARSDIEGRIRTLRIDGDLSLFDTPDGRYWAPTRDLPTVAEMIYEQRQRIYGMVRRGEVVVDCGSNIGVFTRQALQDGARLVIAVEISPQVITCFRRNFEKEIAAGRVVLSTKGVWDKNEELQLTTGEGLASTANSVALDRGSRLVSVQLTTLDSIIETVKPDRVDLIKMDIEGAEHQALTGAVATVRKFRPRIAVALEHRPADIDTLPPLVRQLWPDRQVSFGRCGNVHDRIQPQIAFVL